MTDQRLDFHMALETYITLQVASQQYNLDAQLLTRSVESGKIQGGRFNGTFVLLEKDARRMTKDIADAHATKRKLRAKVAHLEGQSISMSDAAKKYGLTHPSISRWTTAGYIRVRERGGKGLPTLVDESDVAYAHELAKLHQAGQGKRVFSRELLPDWF